MKKLFIFLSLIVTSLFVFTSCTTVEPWERGGLSDPIMIMDENPIDKGIQLHHLEYREGSAGGTGAQSGGCGCG
jgi:hypothetical protein